MSSDSGWVFRTTMLGELKRWATHSYHRTAEMGVEGASKSAFQLYKGLWRLGGLVPVGTNVYEHDWDVLAVVDACRYDLMTEVASEYDYIDEVDHRYSVGSHSMEWIEKTFTEEYSDAVRETAYVSANPHSRSALSVPPSELGQLDEAWRYGCDEEEGTVPPRVVTDRTIRAAREGNTDRVIAHYMQPHQPFIADETTFTETSPIEGDFADEPDTGGWSPGDIGKHNVWRMYRRREVSRSELWEAYRDNLRLVLDDIELLLEGVDGTVVITADHGNALGEWRMYGHTYGFLHPSVRKVPWVPTEAEDTGEYVPDDHADREELDDNEEILRSLGYLN